MPNVALLIGHEAGFHIEVSMDIVQRSSTLSVSQLSFDILQARVATTKCLGGNFGGEEEGLELYWIGSVRHVNVTRLLQSLTFSDVGCACGGVE